MQADHPRWADWKPRSGGRSELNPRDMSRVTVVPMANANEGGGRLVGAMEGGRPTFARQRSASAAPFPSPVLRVDRGRDGLRPRVPRSQPDVPQSERDHPLE